MMTILKSGSLTINEVKMEFKYSIKGNQPPNGYTLIFGFKGTDYIEQGDEEE